MRPVGPSIVLIVAIVASSCGSSKPSLSPSAGPDASAPQATTSASATNRSPSNLLPTVPVATAKPPPGTSPWPSVPAPTDAVGRWTVEVIEALPHDPLAYTQGLELAEGVLYESDGLYGESSLRAIDPTTGEQIAKVYLDASVFGEGLTVVGDEIVQLTWREGRALRHDRQTLAPVGEWSYSGEGWGLCLMGDRLLMTDGSENLTSRNPDDFSVTSVVPVTIDGQPVTYLNELECVGDLVVANIYTTTDLVVIDPTDGRVVATIDASSLLGRVEGRIGNDQGNVLNGIADLGDGTLLLAGKRWPESFVVRIIES